MVEKKTTTRKPRATKATVKTAGTAKPAAEAPLPKPVKEKKEKETVPAVRYIYAVGRRKTATAKVKLFPGEGNVTVNNKLVKDYFAWPPWLKNAVQPLSVVGAEKNFDVTAKVLGGGTHSQAQALAHGIARALVIKDDSYRKVLKPFGFLTRDSRKKERKKPGLKKARRAPQWSKR